MTNIYQRFYDKVQAGPAGRPDWPVRIDPPGRRSQSSQSARTGQLGELRPEGEGGGSAGTGSRPRIGRNSPWLAPLAGHTDLVLRVLCRELGAAVCCTEMVSAKGLLYGERCRSGRNPTVDLLRTLYLPEPGCRPAPGPSFGAPPFCPVAGQKGVSARNLVLNARGAREARTELLAAAGVFPAGSAADSPLVVQLFGDDPDFLGQAVALLREWGYEWFDLNLGCSVPKVTRAGSGAALARDLGKTLEAARRMIAAAGTLPSDPEVAGRPDREAAATPSGRVGFKLRLGWSAEEENYLELARGLEQCGAAWLTLHPRYARQGFAGSADWSALARLRRAVRLPVMASGDLFDADSALRCLEESGADGVMFARGALQNPAVFLDYRQLLRQRTGPEETAGVSRSPHSHPAGSLGAAGRRASLQPDFLRALILRHAELARAMAGVEDFAGGKKRGEMGRNRPEGSLLKMRGSIPRYVKDLPGSRALRVAMSHCATWPEFYALVDGFFADLKSASQAGKPEQR